MDINLIEFKFIAPLADANFEHNIEKWQEKLSGEKREPWQGRPKDPWERDAQQVIDPFPIPDDCISIPKQQSSEDERMLGVQFDFGLDCIFARLIWPNREGFITIKHIIEARELFSSPATLFRHIETVRSLAVCLEQNLKSMDADDDDFTADGYIRHGWTGKEFFDAAHDYIGKTNSFYIDFYKSFAK